MTPFDPNTMKAKAPSAAAAAAPAEAPAAPPAALSAPPDMAVVWHALTKRWLTILVLGAGLGAAGAAVAWFVVPAKYTAVATLHLDPHPPQGSNESSDDFGAWRANMATQIKSDPFLEATLMKPEAAELPEVRAQGKNALGFLRGATLVDEKTSGPESLRLTVSADGAEDAAALANLWAQACGEVYTAHEEGRIKERIKQLAQNYHDTAALLRGKKTDLRTRRDLLHLDDPRLVDAKLLAEEAQLTPLHNQHVQLELEVKRLERRVADLKAGLAAPDKLEVSASAVEDEIDKDFPQNPVVKAQIDEMLALQKKMAERFSHLPTSDRDNDTGVVQYRQGIADIQKTLNSEREQMRPDYEKRLRAKTLDHMKEDAAKGASDIEGLKGQLETLDSKLREADGRIAALRAGGATIRSNPEVEAMQAEVDQMEGSVKQVGQEQANLEAMLPLAPRVAVMEQATAPSMPNLDKRLKAAGGAFFGLFGLVFVGVALAEYRARRVYKSGDVSQGLGLPLMGTVPTLPADARAAVPAAEVEALGPMIESMDAIRTLLLHAGRAESLRVVMVASAVSGEGKTSLASHLAASLARGGRRTLLVDGDLRNPTAHRLFNLASGPGFSELLRGEVEPAQVVQNTPLENLSLLAAGAADRRALQALAQEGILRTVFDELKEQYDFLIVDVSPVLPVADALLIGEHADAVLMSVLRNVSRLPAVHAAQQRLASLGIRILGAVVIGEGLEAYGNVRYPSVAASARAEK